MPLLCIGMANFSVQNYRRSHRNFKVATIILILLGLIWSCEGLRMCYNCNSSTSGLDCVYNPSNVTDGEISCKGRRESLYYPENKNLVSLERTCEINPRRLDEVFVETHLKVYFRTCKSYLCNRGSGVESLKDIPVDPSWDLYADEDLDSNDSFHIQPMKVLCSLLSILTLTLTLKTIHLV